jgi:hypothetical protein
MELKAVKVASMNDWHRALAISSTRIVKVSGVKSFCGIDIIETSLLPRGMAALLFADGTAYPFHLFPEGDSQRPSPDPSP